MPDDSPLAHHLELWMQRRGWESVSEGSAGRMWVNPKVGEDDRIGVFRNLEAESYQFRDIVERLSQVHRLATKEIADSLRNWTIDVTYLTANDVADSISLSAGAAMLETVRMMYRSAATAAIKPRPTINGSFSKLGDTVADHVRIGHTIKGSYVIPVLVAVGEPSAPEPSLFTNEVNAAMESLERRATRTFAEAFTAVHDEVVAPEKSPSNDTLQQLVTKGVTREFVSAMTRALRHEAVSTLSAKFEWAPAQGKPADIPSAVAITADAAPKLALVSERLRSAKAARNEVFTGPVVVVAREPEDKQTRFAIRTVRGGQPCRIETVTSEPLRDVLEWMREKTIVQISGTVDRLGNGLSIEKPVEVAAFHRLPETTDL